MNHSRVYSQSAGVFVVADLRMVLRQLLNMTKPTISLLVVVTSIPTLILAAGGLPHWSVFLATTVGTWLASASGAVFNQIIDKNIDGEMQRTKSRAIPSGQIPPLGAALYGLVLGALGMGLLCAFGTPLAAGIALSANLFYVLVYTAFLKKRTVQNIVIGGAAGAVGPLIGWAMVDPQLGWVPWLLFLMIFLWTPPHFWALAIKYKDDYAKAGIPMLPVVRGYAETRKQILLYTISLFPVVVALYFFSGSSLFGLSLNLFFTGLFFRYALRLYASADNRLAMPVFHYSCAYMFLICGVLTTDYLVFF